MCINKSEYFIWKLLKESIRQLAIEATTNRQLAIEANILKGEIKLQAILINLKILCRRFLTDISAADSLIGLLFRTASFSILQDNTFAIFGLVSNGLLAEVLEYLYTCVDEVKYSLPQDTPRYRQDYSILAKYPFISLYSHNNDYIQSNSAIINEYCYIDPHCYVSTRIYREVIAPLYDVICKHAKHYNAARFIYDVFASGAYYRFAAHGYHYRINPIPNCTIDPNLVLHFLKYYPKQKTQLYQLFITMNKDDMYEFCKLCIQERDLKNINAGISLYNMGYKGGLRDRGLFYLAYRVGAGVKFILELSRLGCDQQVSILHILVKPYMLRKISGECIHFPDLRISKRCFVASHQMPELWRYVKILLRYHLMYPHKKIISELEYQLIVKYNNKLAYHERHRRC